MMMALVGCGSDGSTSSGDPATTPSADAGGAMLSEGGVLAADGSAGPANPDAGTNGDAGHIGDAGHAVDAAPGSEGGASAQDFVNIANFGTNPGGLKMYIHVPAGLPRGAPLVVALHGCSQVASDYVNAGWSELSDRFHFSVAYPEEQLVNNATGCFRWFDPTQNARGQGELESISQMVTFMKAQYGAGTVFATGLSAGGAMTAALLAGYPDVFHAGAIMAGIPYGCATTALEGVSCLSFSADKTAPEWGTLVRSAYPGYAGSYPSVSIWQGSIDTVVNPTNLTQLVRQWTDANGIDATADATSTVLGTTYTAYQDAAKTVRVETYQIPNMPHGTAISPGYAPAGGCGKVGPYILDEGICSTYYVGRFFGLVP